MILLLVSFILVAACGKKVKEDAPTPEVATPALTVERYLELVNDHRINLRLRSLDIAPIIDEQAFEHSRAMAAKKRSFGHYGKALRCRKIKEEFGSGSLCAEIISKGPRDPQELFKEWINSYSDRQNIEGGHFTHTGIGFQKDEEGTIYWTQIFYADR